MKVYIVLEDVGNPYEHYPIIKKVFATEQAADDYISEQIYPHNYDLEDWIIHDE